ncbi:MAG: PKD domain containing protein, partial [Clostridia bacterium 41_269]
MRTGRRVTFFTALFLTVMMLFNAVPVYAWSDSGLPCSTGTFVRLYGFDDAPGGYYLGTWRVTITGAKSGSGRTVHINTFENGGGYGYNFVKYGDIEKVAKELNGNPDWVAEEAEEYKVKISWNSGSQDRIYIRHLAKLCGGVVTRYEQGQIDVLTTPYPTANISLPSTIKAGESVKISISGTSNVHKSCPQDISYVLKIEDDTVKEGKKSKSFSEQASYTFNKAGEYTLVLEVTDGVGRTTTVEKEVTVKAQATPPEPEPPSDGNYPPVADFDMPSSAEVGESVRITDQSYDRDGKIVNWKWEVSPSTYSGTLSGSSGGTLTFNQAGTYTIKLTVTDDDGATDSESKKIYVGKSEPEPPPPPPTPENNPPVAKFKMPSVTGPGKEVQVTNTSYDSDGEIVEVEWDISPEDGVTNNLGDDGGTLVFSKLGTYTVELTVTDDFGDSDSYEKEIEVVNEAPKARISMPETAMQGEDITIESLSSDPDGEIVDMIWSVEPSNGMVGTLSGEKSTVYFDVPGTYTITLKVIDNYGGEATDTEQIEITPAIPKAFFTDQGVYKQNRKLTFIEQGISPSRYTIDTREWVIEPVGNGATQEAIKIKGNLTDQTIYALFKTPGDYKVRLRVHNTAGNWSEWYEQTYTIYPDEPPVADFWVDSVVLREYTDTPGDENAEYYAVISPRDASYTTDGDTISRRVWKYKYDSDNDGSFEDETWQVLSDGNEMTPELRTTEVGKYLFELEVYEEFGEETLEEFLTPEDVRSDNTADKAVDDKRSEVSNLRPVVSFDLIRKKKADIIFTVGNIEAMPSMTWSNQYYDRAQFTQVIEAESSSAIKSGTWHLNPAGNVVWMSNGSIKATFSKAGRAVYVQLNDCDHNDGYIDVYVDGVFYGSQNTRGQGHYACEITNLPNTTHTVEVKTGGNGDLHIDYFAIKDMPQTVFDATIAQNLDGLINQYLKPALNENSVDYKISSVQTSTITSQTNFPWKVYNLYGTGLGTGDGQFSVDGNSYRYRGYGSEAPIDHLYYDDGLNAVREFTFNIDMTGYNACATVIPGFIFGANDTNGFKGYIALMWHNAVGVYYFSGNNHTVLTRNGAGNVAANRNPSSFGGQQVAYVNTRSFSLQKSFKMIYKAPTLEIYEDGALLTTVNCPQAAGTGYGVAAANSSHGCGARSYIQFQNFTLKTTAGVTLDEVLKNSSLWRENSARFLVNISAAPYPEFNDPAKAAYIYSRLLSDRIDFCVLGSSANQAQAINVININDSNGTFILNSNRNTTMQQLTDYIINKINSLYPPITDYVLLKEEVYYQTYYEDSENDPKHSEQWTYQHDPNYFENTLGLAPYHNHPLPGPVTVFDKVGKFDVEFIARDNPKDDDRFDEYRLWSLKPLVGKTLYVHRKPIAQFTVTLTPSGSN